MSALEPRVMLRSLSAMIDVFRINPDVSPIFPHMLSLIITTQRFPHVKCIFALFCRRGIVTVIIHHSSVYGISMIERWVSRAILHPMFSCNAGSYPKPSYRSMAVLLPSRTNKSTNHAFCCSQPRSSTFVKLCASPNRLDCGATVRAVT